MTGVQTCALPIYSEAIAKTFKITGLDGVFTIVNSVRTALRDDVEAA